ncbi:MAG: hypothetical protein AVDCRST_MAG66-813, partial [uncultured Pseudonocardia sp.]
CARPACSSTRSPGSCPTCRCRPPPPRRWRPRPTRFVAAG